MELPKSMIDHIYEHIKGHTSEKHISIRFYYLGDAKIKQKIAVICRYNSNGKHPLYICTHKQIEYLSSLPISKDDKFMLTLEEKDLAYGEHIDNFKINANTLLRCYYEY